MKKDKDNIKKVNTNKKNKFLYFDWIILVFFVLSILSNIVLFWTRPELMNFVVTHLFQIFQLIFVIYFTVRITKFSLSDKTTENQKSIAKTAIRQIRNTQTMTENLKEIVNSKKDSFRENKMVVTLEEINNHLNSLSINLTVSESAFKDILGEEFKEEHLIWAQINQKINLLNEKRKEENSLRERKEEEDKVHQSELQKEINELRNRISTDISSLPITGYTSSYTHPNILGITPLLNLSNIVKASTGKFMRGIWNPATPSEEEKVIVEETEEKGQEEDREQEQKKKTTKKTKK